MSNHALVDSILDMVFEELSRVKWEDSATGNYVYRIGQARWHDLRAKCHYFYGGDKKSPMKVLDENLKKYLESNKASLPPFMR